MNEVRTDAMAAGSLRAEELAYVTAHLRDMQGMIGAPFVLAFAAWTLWVHLHEFSMERLAWLFAAAGLFGLIAGGAVQRWYRRRFGFVKQPDFAVPSGLQLLSLGNPAPPPPPRSKYGGRNTQGLAVVYLFWSGINLVSLVTSTRHLHDVSSLLLFTIPLMPGSFSRTPPSALLRLRRALWIAALLTLLLLGLAFSRSLVTKWDVVNSISAGYLLIAAYDHWLLMHFLPGVKPGLEDACGS